MKKTPLAIIFLIIFIDLLGFGIVIPILPSYAMKGLGADDFMIGIILSSFSLMVFIFTPIWGKLSDRIGRKPVLIIGLVASIIGYMMFAVTNSLLLLILSRLLAGIGGANISAAQAYIADVTPPDQRAKGMGLIGAAFGLGFVFGPFIGGTLSAYGYHVPGFLAAGLSALSLIFTIIVLPEPQRVKDHQDVSQMSFFSMRDFKFLFTHPEAGKLIALNFLIIFAMSNIYAVFALFGIKDFQFDDREIGYLFAGIGIMSAITQGGLIRHAVKWIDEHLIFFVGNIIMMITLFWMPFSTSALFLYISTMVYAIGTGANTPTSLSLISQNTSRQDQGTVLGINQSISSLARVLGPMTGSFFFQHLGHKWPFLNSAVLMVVVTLLSGMLLSRKKNTFQSP